MLATNSQAINFMNFIRFDKEITETSSNLCPEKMKQLM